jgi:hypothetical protein
VCCSLREEVMAADCEIGGSGALLSRTTTAQPRSYQVV